MKSKSLFNYYVYHTPSLFDKLCLWMYLSSAIKPVPYNCASVLCQHRFTSVSIYMSVNVCQYLPVHASSCQRLSMSVSQCLSVPVCACLSFFMAVCDFPWLFGSTRICVPIFPCLRHVILYLCLFAWAITCLCLAVPNCTNQCMHMSAYV